MPYVTKDARDRLDGGGHPLTPGELNYAITRALVRYLDATGRNYQTINDILGALEGAKAEFYRRVAVPYEEEKRRLNGDVYPKGYL